MFLYIFTSFEYPRRRLLAAAVSTYILTVNECHARARHCTVYGTLLAALQGVLL